MRKKTLILGYALLAGVGVLCAATNDAAPRNMLKNGDFENGSMYWKTPEWFKSAFAPVIDKSNNQGPGMGSLKATGEGNRQCYFIQQIVIPRGCTKLRLSGYMKTAGFQNGWTAWIQGQCFSDIGPVGRGFPLITPPAKSDTDWTFYTMDITLPPEAKYFRVILMTNGPGNDKPNAGKAWFDNISLTVIPEDESAPADVNCR